MSHEIELYGCLTIPDDANFDEITRRVFGFYGITWLGLLVVGSLRFEMAVM